MVKSAEGRALPCCWLCLHVRARKAWPAAVGHGSVWAGLGLVRLSRSSPHCSQISHPNYSPPKHLSLPSPISLVPSHWWEQPALASLDDLFSVASDQKSSLQKSRSLWGIEGHPRGPALSWTHCWQRAGAWEDRGTSPCSCPRWDGLTWAGHSVKVLELDFNSQAKLNGHFSPCPMDTSPYK